MSDDGFAIPPRPPRPSRRGSDVDAEPAPTPQPETSTWTWARRMVREPQAWLVVYAVALALIAFWPVPVDSGAGPFLRAVTRLVPMLTYDRIEFGANIVLFVPWGLLLTLLIRRERWLVLPIAFVTTVTIECGQAVALAARTPSVLDIIANTAGACVGMLIAVFVELLARSRTPLP